MNENILDTGKTTALFTKTRRMAIPVEIVNEELMAEGIVLVSA